MNKNRLLPFLSLLFILLTLSLNAQQGKFLYLWGGPQYVKIGNYDDYFDQFTHTRLSEDDTYRKGFGVDYVYNFSPSVGFQTGLAYSEQGQKYKGTVDSAQDYYYQKDPIKFKSRGVPYDYNSHIYLNYLRLPIDIRFTALSEDEYRLGMAMYFGFYLAYLMNVQEVATSPAPPDSFVKENPGFKFISMYNRLDFGIDAGAQFNVRLSQKIGTGIGLRFDRSFTDIEKRNISIPQNDTRPIEWLPPVSTPKTIRPGTDDYLTRAYSANNVVNLYLCFYYRFGGGGKPTQPPTQ